MGFRRVFCAILIMGISQWSQSAMAAPVAVDGRVAISTYGDGPDVLLIPGLASSEHVWDRTVSHLKGRYRVHVVQVFGFAGAPPQANREGALIVPVTDAIHRYLVDRHLAPVSVIGHSLGGLMGMELALRHPSDVRRLMIVDALPFFGAIFGARDVQSVVGRATSLRDSMLHETRAAYIAGAERMVPSLVKTTGPEADVVKAASIASDQRVVARAMYEDMTTDLADDVSKIRQPTVLLYPWDKDSGMDATMVDRFYHAQYATYPNVTFARIDGSRHFIMIDQPEVFETQVDAFLRK